MKKTIVFSNYKHIVDICKGNYDLANDVVLDLITNEDYENQDLLTYDTVYESINRVTGKQNNHECEHNCTNCKCKSEENKKCGDELCSVIETIPQQYREVIEKIFLKEETVDEVAEDYSLPAPVILMIFSDGIAKVPNTNNNPIIKAIKDIGFVNLVNRYYNASGNKLTLDDIMNIIKVCK